MKPLSTTHKKFGNRIKELRGRKHMTQEELAYKVGIDRSYMGFVERGERNPTLTRLIDISKALKVTLSELFRSVD